MAGYLQASLNEMIKNIGEDKVKNILSDFCCPLNRDVDDFLKSKAIEFEKQSISVTYLVFTSYKGGQVLIGYYTLASKSILVYEKALSKTLRKRISKFANYDCELKRYELSSPLIGQLGKNFNNEYNKLITGDELLNIACEKVKEIQRAIGGKTVYLECEDKEKLINFYSANGFYNFGRRKLDRDEVEIIGDHYLIQLLKYLK